MPTRRFTVLVLTGSLLVGSMLSACSDGDAKGAGSPGSAGSSGSASSGGGATASSEDGTTRVGPVTLTVPRGWVKDPKAASRNEDASWVSPSGGSTPAQGVTVVLTNGGRDMEAAFARHAAATQTFFPGVQRGAEQHADVP